MDVEQELHPSSTKLESTFDNLLSELRGRLSYFHMYLFAFSCCVVIPVSVCTVLPLFILTIPDHRCALNGWENDTYSVQNSHHRQLINASIPVNQNGRLSSCKIFSYGEGNESSSDVKQAMPCHQWVYDKTFFDRTLIEELDLVCDDKHVRTSGNMLLMVGKLLGTLLFGFCSDRFGRKLSIILCMIGLVIAPLSSAFIYDIPSLYILRFVAGLGLSQVLEVVFILVVENLESQHRGWYSGLLYTFWAVGGFIVLGMGYLLRDFQHLSFAIAAPTSVLLVSLWFIPESPRWLFSRGRQFQARKVLLRMARVNKVAFPEEVFADVVATFNKSKEQNNQETDDIPKNKFLLKCLQHSYQDTNEQVDINERKTTRFLYIFKHESLYIRCFILIYLWFAFKVCYIALMFNLSNLKGSVYLNFGLFNFIDAIGVVLACITMNKTGRSVSYRTLVLLSTVACLASVLPMLLGTQVVSTIAIHVLGLIAVLGINGANVVLVVYSAELVPTIHRSLAISVFDFCGRMGSVVGSVVADIGLFWGGRLKSTLPLPVCGCVLLVAFILACFLPETKGVPMPNTVQEAILIKRNNKQTCRVEGGNTESNC